MLFRNRYNNHHASDPYISSIHKKLATDIQKSYSIDLPCWTLRFLIRFFIASLGYVTRKHKGKFKGREVNDPSALLLGNNESRSLNSHIDIWDTVAMPPVHYQSSRQRIWRRIYNLHINHPDKDIMIYKYDLVSDFCRLSCHPDVAAAYDFVLCTYLVIAVGMVFRSRDALSLFCLLSNLISFASLSVHHLPLSRPTTSIIDWVGLPHAPPSSRDINPDRKYPMNQNLDGTKLGPQPRFVNDTIMAEVRYLIHREVDNSFLATSVFFGNSNLVKETISIEKFERFFTHLSKILGFVFNSMSMTASYTDYNRASLSWLSYSHPNGILNPPTRSNSYPKF